MPDLAGDDDVAQVDSGERRTQFFVRANTGPQGESLGLGVEKKQDDILASIFLKDESDRLCRIIRRNRVRQWKCYGVNRIRLIWGRLFRGLLGLRLWWAENAGHGGLHGFVRTCQKNCGQGACC